MWFSHFRPTPSMSFEKKKLSKIKIDDIIEWFKFIFVKGMMRTFDVLYSLVQQDINEFIRISHLLLKKFLDKFMTNKFLINETSKNAYQFKLHWGLWFLPMSRLMLSIMHIISRSRIIRQVQDSSNEKSISVAICKWNLIFFLHS
jgi:hypothetical protein